MVLVGWLDGDSGLFLNQLTMCSIYMACRPDLRDIYTCSNKAGLVPACLITGSSSTRGLLAKDSRWGWRACKTMHACVCEREHLSAP